MNITNLPFSRNSPQTQKGQSTCSHKTSTILGLNRQVVNKMKTRARYPTYDSCKSNQITNYALIKTRQNMYDINARLYLPRCLKKIHPLLVLNYIEILFESDSVKVQVNYLIIIFKQYKLAISNINNFTDNIVDNEDHLVTIIKSC